MGFVELDDLKSELDITKTSADARLQRLIDSISWQVQRYYGKTFEASPPFDDGGGDTAAPVAVAVPISYTPASIMPSAMRSPAAWGAPGSSPPFRVSLAGPVTVKIPHAREITAVGWDTVALTTDQYTLETAPEVRGTFYRRVTVFDSSLTPAQTLTVTGRFGIVPVPPDITDAILAACARRYKEAEARYGDLVQQPDGAQIRYFKALPASVQQIFDSYQEIGI